MPGRPGQGRAGPGRAGPGRKGMRPGAAAGLGRAGPGQYQFFPVRVRRGKSDKSVGGSSFFAQGTEEAKLPGRPGPGPGWAGPGQAGPGPKRTAGAGPGLGWAGPDPSIFPAGYGKRHLMTHRHIYLY